MPKHIAPIQIYLPSGMAEGRLPFVIVTPADSIQAAIDIVSPLGLFPGKHIWLWPGTWTLFAPLTIPVGAEIYIWGCGYDSIIQMDPGGGGPTPMFQLAAGVVEFQLHDLRIEQQTFPTDVIGCLGACTHVYLDNVLMNLPGGGVDGTNVIRQTAAANITNCEIEHCILQGILDLRGVTNDLHDSDLSANNAGHNFADSAVVYAARNHWSGGVGAATVTINGANALYHDEGSNYGGDAAMAVVDGDVNLRGCWINAATGATITHVGGSLRLAECRVENTGNQPCINNGAGATYIGVHDCHILATAGGVDWGVVLGGCGGEIIGCRFEDAGFDTSFPCTFAANIMDSVVVQSVIRVQCNNVSITGNNIIACAHAGGIAIELDVNDNCTVTGNQLQNYTVNENAGATGNIITGNRVGA